MTEMQSAIGHVHLSKLPQWVSIGRAHAQRLNSALADVPGLRLTIPPAHIGHSYYKYYAFAEPSRQRDGWNRYRIIAEVAAHGVQCQVGGCSEIYLEKAFRAELRPTERLPVAKELGETSIMLQVHPTLTSEQVDLAAECLREVALSASRPVNS